MCKKQLNTYQVLGNIVIIFTRKGEQILVDLDDFPLIADFNWYLSKGYAKAYDPAQQKTISMHRLLMNPPNFLEVDHINHHPWDNRRSNLRITTTAQNQSNSKLRIDNTSGYKGVTFNKRQRKWKAHIRVDGEKKHLGLFSTIEEAVIARQLAEIKYHGLFNMPNSLYHLASINLSNNLCPICPKFQTHKSFHYAYPKFETPSPKSEVS